MIAATVVFGCIAYFEWHYLRRHDRSKRTVRIVFGMLSLLWLITFTVAMFRERISVGSLFASLFEPLQRLLFMI
ncbi:hypothetical protein GZH47_02735 [Paenibacillus rhizovicinus]|uniref:Uncharacterized protein n=1 Tax=Paenibacillus rhizovicinus TaxID=2704463 RepID=A0A6C0NVU4_9BACL|nr:hypothetical protein [Paenibacillus rhizovicinus]QHW29853.1 hypothetical protein GZH47_02735 [Paenibacillus rhizovicinus]